MNDTAQTVVAIALLFVGLPLLILWVRDRTRRVLRQRRHPPEQALAERRAYEQRILQPDWESCERHLQRSLPLALRELYGDRDLITSQDLPCHEDYVLSTFEALDDQAMVDTQVRLGFQAVAIATTDSGDSVYLRPGSGEVDRVYITHHDGGDTELFAESIAGLLAALREANRQSERRD